MRKTGLKLKQQKWGRMRRCEEKRRRRKLKNRKRERWNGNGRKREEEWKAATKEMEGNVKEYWRNHHSGVIEIWSGREEWGRRKRKKDENEKKGVEIKEKEEQLMTNLNEAKLMNEESWIETKKFFLLFSCVSAFHFSIIVSCISDPAIFFSCFANFFKFFLIFVVFVEKEFEETDEEICKIGKKDCQIGNAGDNRRGMKCRNTREKEEKEKGWRGTWGKKWKYFINRN